MAMSASRRARFSSRSLAMTSIDSPGSALRIGGRRPGSTVAANTGLVVIFTRPGPSVAGAPKARASAVTSGSIALAWSCSLRARSVGASSRPRRRNSGSPQISSKRRIWRPRVGCVWPRLRAAADSVPVRTTSTKARISAQSAGSAPKTASMRECIARVRAWAMAASPREA